MRYPNLFKPLTLNQLTLRNRIVSTAHAEVYAEPGGLPGDRYIRYYEEKAKGGVGLAVCGGSSPVSIDSPQGWWKSVNLSTDKIIDPLSRLAEAMHRHGAKIMIQATHMGRRSAFHGEHWPHLMSPSGVREPVHRATCKTIEPEEIWRVIGNRPSLTESHGVEGPSGPRVLLSEVPYPSGANDAITPYTIPSSRSPLGGGSPVHITNIRRLPDGRISFHVGYEYQ